MILNESNGKVYIGQSIDLNKRKESHRNLLEKNKHHNQHLQNAWNKYGEDSFKFLPLEYCLKNQLNNNEKWWIDYFNSNNGNYGYNLTTGGDSNYTFRYNHIGTSKSNSTGFFKVNRFKDNNYKKGYAWRYVYIENNTQKCINASTLDKLRNKVIYNLLLWGVTDESKARKICDDENLVYEEMV